MRCPSKTLKVQPDPLGSGARQRVRRRPNREVDLVTRDRVDRRVVLLARGRIFDLDVRVLVERRSAPDEQRRVGAGDRPAGAHAHHRPSLFPGQDRFDLERRLRRGRHRLRLEAIHRAIDVDRVAVREAGIVGDLERVASRVRRDLRVWRAARVCTETDDPVGLPAFVDGRQLYRECGPRHRDRVLLAVDEHDVGIREARRADHIELIVADHVGLDCRRRGGLAGL